MDNIWGRSPSHEKYYTERGRHPLVSMAAAPSPPPQLQDTILSRWHNNPETASLSSASSPTRTAAYLIRSRFAGGARIKRLFLVLGGLFLLTVCMFHLNGQGHGLGASVSSGMRHLRPWGISEEEAARRKAAGTIPDDPERPAAEVGDGEFDTSATTHLPHIPGKIWQIYLDFKPTVVSVTYLASWLAHSPSFSYTLLDAAGAQSMVRRLVGLAEGGDNIMVPMYPDVFRQSTSATKSARDVEGDGDATAETTETTEAETGTESASTMDDDAPMPTQTMTSLDFARDALTQYKAMPRRVLRADFMRYLALALEGGVYSDMDTWLVRQIGDWVPEKFRADVKLIVGLESDSSPPVKGTTYEVQFCQWTLASAPDHPTMWTMLDRILGKVRNIKTGLLGDKLSDKDVLEITGPAGWTEVVFEHLNQVAGTGIGQPRITWETLTGMREPQLYGDTLVLPIDGFATGVPHSHASKSKSQQTLVQHQFQGNWRDDRG